MRTSHWMIALMLISWAAYGRAADAVVHLHETFDTHPVGALTANAPLYRASQVRIIDGKGKVGSGQVAHIHDQSTEEGGALEYNLGSAPLGSLFIEFDLLNNDPFSEAENMPVIFGVGPWNTSGGLLLNAHARRAFALEFHQSGSSKHIVLRIGTWVHTHDWYTMSEPQNVKVWVNDHDTNTLSYKQPDSGETALLNPNSVVVWINNQLVGFLDNTGVAMQESVTGGDCGLGRVGFGSTTKSTVSFLVDNLHVEDPSGTSEPKQGESAGNTVEKEVTPEHLPGATAIPYRRGQDAMNLFVYRPEGWNVTDKRSAMIFFFGGGWTKGTPLKSASWARWAAAQGMVGIAPDYRTKNRFGTSPLESVADGRAALNWVIRHADKLGVDPRRIVVGGTSAGGHVALWTAIAETPPGSNPDEAPSMKPAAVILSSAVTDTSARTGYTPQRFGEHADALSPVHQLDAQMPDILMFHARDDDLVAYSSAVALAETMNAAGNRCELVTVPEGGHGYTTAFPEWKTKVRDAVQQFLVSRKLLPAQI